MNREKEPLEASELAASGLTIPKEQIISGIRKSTSRLTLDEKKELNK